MWKPVLIDVEAGDSFITETERRIPLSVGWRQRVAAAATPAIDALVWDDLLFRISKRGRVDYLTLKWPAPDELLVAQVDQRSRCAVRGTLARQLATDGIITNPSDTNAVMRWLTVNRPQSIRRVAGVFRYTRRSGAEIYRPLAPPPSPAGKADSISVIINYRDRPDPMQHCLAAIGRQRTRGALEIILIDNQSEPQSRARVEEIAAKVILNGAVRHLNYDHPFNKSAQDNMGVRTANGVVTVLMNNDAELVEENCLQLLADWAMSDGVASAGPSVLGHGTEIVSNGVFIRAPSGQHPSLIQESESPIFARLVHRTAGNSFCCAAVSKAVWQRVGALDENVFTSQYNDADFFMRTLDLGLKHVYVGSVSCRHVPGATEFRDKAKTRALLDRFRERYPSLGKYAEVDFDLMKTGALPAVESWTAQQELNLAQAWQHVHRVGQRANRMFFRYG